MRKKERQKKLLIVSLVFLLGLVAAFLIKDYVTKYEDEAAETAYVVEIGGALSRFGQGLFEGCSKIAHKTAEGFSKAAFSVKTFFTETFKKEELSVNESVDNEYYGEQAEFDFSDNGQMLESEQEQGSPSKVVNEGMTIVTNSSGVRYLAFMPGADSSGMDIVRYLIIPSESSGLSFRPMQDLVYAISETNLYLDAALKSTSFYPVYQGKCFTRTGICENGVYQLVDSNKQIVYADGSFFCRFKEDTNYDEEISLPEERYELELNLYMQNPQLPNGCEITSLAMLLDYYGYKVDKCKLADDYLPKAPAGEANFYEEYVGNPRLESGLGCYAPAIVKAANDYLKERNSSYCARDYTGCSFNEVISQLKKGNPCIVWVSSYMDVEPRLTTHWLIDGEHLTWKSNLHCLVVSGYDGINQKIITYDPLYGIKEYDLDLFVKRFKQYYSQIVVVDFE